MKMKRSIVILCGCISAYSRVDFVLAQGYLEQAITTYRIDQATYSSIGNSQAYLLENELLRRIETLYPYRFKSVEGLPFKRQILGFSSAKAAIAMGFCAQNESLDYVLQEGHQRYPLISAPLYRYQGFRIYTRASDPIINSLEALKSKKVGVVRGMALPAKLRDLNSK